MDKRSKLEIIFERLLWKSRLIVIIAVVCGVIGSSIMFVVASFDIWHTINDTLNFFIRDYTEKEEFHSKLISQIIGAVDLYLIAVVILIFSFGLYELFVSDIDDAENTKVGKRILSIHSLDELKDKIGKVIVMVLIVSFFKRMMHMNLNSPIHMLYFALCILALALALYLMHKN